MQKYVGVSEIADMLSVSRQTIYDWRKDLSMPYIKVRRKVLFDIEQVKAWLSEHAVQGKIRS